MSLSVSTCRSTKRRSIGFCTTSAGLTLCHILPQALLPDSALANASAEPLNLDDYVHVEPSEEIDLQSILLASHQPLPVPDANLTPTFASSSLPGLPPIPDSRGCSSNCSNSDLFVFQQPAAIPIQVSAVPEVASNTGLTRPATNPSSETYLQQILTTQNVPLSPAVVSSNAPRSDRPSSSPQLSQAPTAVPEPTGTDNSLRPNFSLRGVSIGGSDELSGRARLTTHYPINQNLLLGASIETVTGSAFTDSQQAGFRLNELYLAASLPSTPNLRLVAGQVDLTSYFDRNSFSKDGATQFFNSAFQTSPAIISTLGSSNPGALINWSVSNNLELRAAVFSSDRDISDFSLDSYAGEIAYRSGNAIIRGTYAAGRDGGAGTGFQNSFLIDRGNGQRGILPDDQEVSYGINGEIFFPEANLGLFARYGYYENQTLNLNGTSFSVGLTAFDLLSNNDRLGVAYGQTVSNETLSQQPGATSPDVVELFYDFEPLENLRLGASIQQVNGFSDTIFQFRLGYETDFGQFR